METKIIKESDKNSRKRLFIFYQKITYIFAGVIMLAWIPELVWKAEAYSLGVMIYLLSIGFIAGRLSTNNIVFKFRDVNES